MKASQHTSAAVATIGDSAIAKLTAHPLDILTANDRPGEYPSSWYAATAPLRDAAPAAQGSLSCDVCVIGGGYTGLSTALHLAQKGYDVVLLEAHRVGWGASGRNGGQVSTGQRIEQDELERLVGLDHARRLWDLSLQSVQIVRDLIEEHHIDCDLNEGIIDAAHRARYVEDSHRYVDKLQNEYGYNLVKSLDQAAMREHVGSDSYFGGVLDMGSAHLHPLKFALGLAKAARTAGVQIFEQSRVASFDHSDPAVVRTDTATITGRFLVLACNGYLGKLEPEVATKVMPINNFIVATESLNDAEAQALIRDNHAVADSRFVVNYFRLSNDNRLLFGGGESYGYEFPTDIQALVRKPMLEIFPQLKDTVIEHAWGGTLGITMNRMPHFSRLKGNVLSASGYSGHGVALATLSGSLMADAIDGQATAFDAMATVPSMRFPGGTLLRLPLLALGMTWYSLRDRL